MPRRVLPTLDLDIVRNDPKARFNLARELAHLLAQDRPKKFSPMHAAVQILNEFKSPVLVSPDRFQRWIFESKGTRTRYEALLDPSKRVVDLLLESPIRWKIIAFIKGLRLDGLVCEKCGLTITSCCNIEPSFPDGLSQFGIDTNAGSCLQLEIDWHRDDSRGAAKRGLWIASKILSLYRVALLELLEGLRSPAYIRVIDDVVLLREIRTNEWTPVHFSGKTLRQKRLAELPDQLDRYYAPDSWAIVQDHSQMVEPTSLTTPIQTMLTRFAVLLGEAELLLNESPASCFVAYVTALERLLSVKKDRIQATCTFRLATRCSLLTSQHHLNGKFARHAAVGPVDICRFYRKRSELVHEGVNDLTAADIVKMRALGHAVQVSARRIARLPFITTLGDFLAFVDASLDVLVLSVPHNKGALAGYVGEIQHYIEKTGDVKTLSDYLVAAGHLVGSKPPLRRSESGERITQYLLSYNPKNRHRET